MTEGRNVWPLRLLAVAIGVVVWMFASLLPRLEQLNVEMFEANIPATVTYGTPESLIILNPDNTIVVRLRGSREAVGALTPSEVVLEVPIPSDLDPSLLTFETGPVRRDVFLGPENVRLPTDQSLTVVSLAPDRISLLIDEEVTRLIQVVPELVGEPGAGAPRPEEGDITIRPRQVQVRGPRSRVERLNNVSARIDLDGHILSFDEQVRVRAADDMVSIVKPTVVEVRVTLVDPDPERDEPSADTVGLLR